jgi:hypothetical protein
MFEIKACEVSEKRSPVGDRDEFFRNKRNEEIGHYGQTLYRNKKMLRLNSSKINDKIPESI